MNRIAFLIPGDLSLPTGGYAYDRAVIRRLPEHGLAPIHVALPGGYPDPTGQDLEDTAAIVASLPEGCPLLIDGLAFGAMPAERIRAFGRPVVALCHHPLALENGIAPERAEALLASERAALALARGTIVTAPATARLLTADFGVPERAIAVAEPGSERQPRATGSASPQVDMLAVGSIVPRKGYSVLIDALAPLTHLPWRLTIAGAARDLATVSALREAIAAAGLDSRVRLLGAVPERDLKTLYETADLFVMASLFEGYGMVLAEAMQRGLPIVTTTGGAAAETVPDGAALKVPPGDAGALRAALETALADPARRAELGDRAHEAARALPDWNHTARAVAAALRRFLPDAFSDNAFLAHKDAR